MFPNDTAPLPCLLFNQSVAGALLPLASDCIHLGCLNLDVNIITLRKKSITPGSFYCENFYVHGAVKRKYFFTFASSQIELKLQVRFHRS